MDFSMPRNVTKQLAKYNHPPTKSQHAPYPTPQGKNMKRQPKTQPRNTLHPPATELEKKTIQQKTESILYYGRAINLTTIMALSTITSDQAQPTQ